MGRPADVEAEWNALVAARKACRICVERSPGRIRSCGEFDFDPDVVSHWEQWLGHKSPKLLVVGQDFGNLDYFLRHRGHDEPHNQTNDNLRRLLAEAGIHTTDPPECDAEAPVFATNARFGGSSPCTTHRSRSPGPPAPPGSRPTGHASLRSAIPVRWV